MHLTNAIVAPLVFVFSPGLGACGIINNDQQIVASVSSVVFNAFPYVYLLSVLLRVLRLPCRNATANPNKYVFQSILPSWDSWFRLSNPICKRKILITCLYTLLSYTREVKFA